MRLSRIRSLIKDMLMSVLWIYFIFVWIRIRGSVSWNSGSEY